MENTKLAAEYIISKMGGEFDCAVILGSGLGDWGDSLTNAVKVPYSEIAGMPTSEVKGHANCFIGGKCGDKKVLVMKGRVHLYEGWSPQDVVYPIRIMHHLGIKNLILTNAAGGVNLSFKPGDLMLITDHINFSGHNPLRGQDALNYGERFPSMSEVYSRELAVKAHNTANECGIMLKDGVYYYSVGPSFETPAEIRAIRVLGGDAVGMSTVHEATAAVQQGMKVLGISCITNMAAGILDQPLTHAEVLETGQRVKEKFAKVLSSIIYTI